MVSVSYGVKKEGRFVFKSSIRARAERYVMENGGHLVVIR